MLLSRHCLIGNLWQMTPTFRYRLQLIYFQILLHCTWCTCHHVTTSTLHQRAVSRYIIEPSQSIAISDMHLVIPHQLINGGIMRTLFHRCLGKHNIGLNRSASSHYHRVVIKMLMTTTRNGRPVKAIIDALNLFHALFHHATALCGVHESHTAFFS